MTENEMETIRREMDERWEKTQKKIERYKAISKGIDGFENTLKIIFWGCVCLMFLGLHICDRLNIRPSELDEYKIDIYGVNVWEGEKHKEYRESNERF